jgi:SIR2-like protein/uncharacterized protein DUF4020
VWIAGVDLPQPLVDAHRSGELVLFVGAGASMSAPSSLPDLRGLTDELASITGVAVPRDRLEQLDLALGYLADREGIQLHRMVADRLSNPASAPNRWHRAIADLAQRCSTPRIVTTNYDLHLSTVLHEAGMALDEYHGPALPMGDDFDGLVYLHGELRQAPNNLILTDRDFGRAYLTDAWASRFLERMFAAYDVLFIGYSHKDVVMTYLARGLRTRSDRTRYALTPEPDDASWPRLRIAPLEYRIDDGSHDAGVVFLEGWARHASMGLLHHRQQIAQLVVAAPSDVPEETSYLESVLADEALAGFFTEFARGPQWLSWVAGRPEFRALLDPNATVPPSARALAWWFTEHFMVSEEHTRHALTMLQTGGGSVGAELWHAIGARLHGHPRPRPPWLAPWIVLLAENLPPDGRDWLEYALLGLDQWPQDRDVAIHVFDRLTAPVLAPARLVLPGTEPSFDVQLCGDPREIREAWTTVFVPNLAEAAADIIVIADHQLRVAHRLLAATGTGWDRLSWGRSAIEPHEQDRFLDAMDALIDAARDCVEFLLNAGDSLGAAYLQAWARSDLALLRRLAVHGWTQRHDVDPTAKLAWLHERDWWFDPHVHHEVYRLLAATIADANRAVADAVVTTIAARGEEPVAPVSTDENAEEAVAEAELRRDRPVFATLAWITKHAPALQTARVALAKITVRHPGWVESDHPDLLHWLEGGDYAAHPPMPVEVLHDLIAADAAAAVHTPREYENTTSMFQRPNWNDATDLLRQAVHTRPADALDVLGVPDLPAELLAAVLGGWSRATVDFETGAKIVDALSTVELTSMVVAEVARLLADDGRDGGDEGPWRRLPAARELAMTLWSALDGDDHAPANVKDWPMLAINRPAGDLASFWLHTLAAEWREAGDAWAGIPESITINLESMLDTGGRNSELAEVILASRLHFFFGADPGWCQARILPLLDWAAPDRALRNWQGFLMWGRFNNKLLALGLLDRYLEAAAHYSDFPHEHQGQLADHLAAVALFSDVDPVASDWLRRLTATDNLVLRTDWHKRIGWQLDHLPADDVEQQWSRWIRGYWTDRIAGVPRALEIEEASAMAGWVINLDASVHDAVDLATQLPAGFGEHADLLHRLGGDDDRVQRWPADIARLVTHLLNNTNAPFYGGYSLRPLVVRLRTYRTETDDIIEEALRLGISDAGTW